MTTETSAHSAAIPRTRPPAPSSISPQAQRVLSTPDAMEAPGYPPLDDIDSWAALASAMDAGIRPFYEANLPPRESFDIDRADVGGVTNYRFTPTEIELPEDHAIFIEIHGGGLYLGAGELAWMAAASHAIGRNGVTWAPDYRMPPAHPFPAALDDLVEVYRAAISSAGAHRVVVSGASGGGNLATALLLRARAAGLPMPAALVLLTPEVDLTESGDSFVLNDGIDMVLRSLMPVNLLYAAGEDLANPLISPLFADLTGLPPTLLQTGTRDLFLSNTVRMHRHLLRAGVDAELHVFEAMPHGGFGGSTPEDEELRAEVRRFEAKQLERARARAEGVGDPNAAGWEEGA